MSTVLIGGDTTTVLKKWHAQRARNRRLKAHLRSCFDALRALSLYDERMARVNHQPNSPQLTAALALLKVYDRDKPYLEHEDDPAD